MAENGLRIKKVKVIESTGKIKIDYQMVHGESQDEMSGIFPEEAAPEFYEAFNKLVIPVCNILELQTLKNAETRVKPYGVTFHYSKDGTMGAVISSKLSLPDAGTEVVINTPMRKCAPDDDSDETSTYFTESAAKFLWQLETETRKYLSGKRNQTTLFGANGQPLQAGEETDEADDLEQQQHEDVDGNEPAAIIPPEVAASNVTDINQYAAQR
jgi:hypothetical protein